MELQGAGKHQQKLVRLHNVARYTDRPLTNIPLASVRTPPFAMLTG